MPTHAEKRILRYTPEQLFDLVADVRRYPEFLPWCVGARVISQNETELVADLTIGFKLFRETFRSRVQLDRPHEVRVRYENGPFRYLNNTWKFHPVQGGTEVDFFVDFEFRSALLQAVIGVVFNEAVRLMVRSFERRAMALYGRGPAAQATTAPKPSTGA
ncbi:type II toxin-antitoxin system RatA family toxin [Pseudoroseomonas wenyumeiae]|uniref:Type II toxin-antitoxin system RatA family toxin n=1 Tax=Teichococcus wenyumeiae TaxID=2478470 RepID=A0A3A9JN00_9PROT|nr:type II toxin-antitoxin system RatA family toxin [Pseudoroseomonas wenyumeiae]RKK06133.1 type II toxin-antitoxin system RatA family toxin [Pseudoroseomonas wenyumeiae]RMI25622.1 type II toxin-antitoxin system RatA family toxin [Pseudoroseomonas wenyumeiae]